MFCLIGYGISHLVPRLERIPKHYAESSVQIPCWASRILSSFCPNSKPMKGVQPPEDLTLLEVMGVNTKQEATHTMSNSCRIIKYE